MHKAKSNVKHHKSHQCIEKNGAHTVALTLLITQTDKYPNILGRNIFSCNIRHAWLLIPVISFPFLLAGGLSSDPVQSMRFFPSIFVSSGSSPYLPWPMDVSQYLSCHCPKRKLFQCFAYPFAESGRKQILLTAVENSLEEKRQN